MREIIIPNYPDKVQIAAARRPIYYVSPSSSVKGKTNIPRSFLEDDKHYFDSRGILRVRKTNEIKLANPKTAGNPRYWVVNFQDIWNQNVARQNRASRTEKLKSILRPFILPIEPVTEYPVKISVQIFDTECPVDISNRGAVYIKIIEDLLVKEGKLIDDSVEYVNCSGTIKFVRTESKEEKKMIVRIDSSDNNPL